MTLLDEVKLKMIGMDGLDKVSLNPGQVIRFIDDGLPPLPQRSYEHRIQELLKDFPERLEKIVCEKF